MKPAMLLAVLVAALLFAGGCRNKYDLDKDGTPRTLIIAAYGGDAPGTLRKKFDVLQAYLEKGLGMKVEIILTTDYTSTIEAMRTKKVHMAYLSPFSYVLASKDGNIVPMVSLGKDGSPTMYHSIIFTNTKTGLKSIADVKERAKSLTFCFADPASTSGHLIPDAYLISQGIDPEHDFKETVFAGSHPATVMSVKSGKVDVGCTTQEFGINYLARKGLVDPADFVVLWQSEPIIGSPVVMRKDINPAFTQKVAQLYVAMAKNAPDAFNAIIQTYYANSDGMAYHPVQDSTYNGIRRMANSIKNLDLTK